ncbi:sensor histidine kinase [Parapedobacter koreensis]|uniref:histidine kinase n=1 Tax=Parapedobacter koreensis TaxID=332977 RepID=A0A1H7PJ11_9SPHI|nr:ATP-binding protein [Parapedobacter koreensis]SEL35275.1 PAS domain S-box-containing protein [Parapedobacter koreensis]
MKNKNTAIADDRNGQDEQVAKYYLAAIVESSQDSIVTIDLNRVITTWNKAAENLYGYKANEVIGKSLEAVMLPKDIVELIENVDKIRNEVSVPIYETVRLHKNGKQADLQIALSPVRDATGAVIGISTIARDVTAAKLHEQLKDEFIAVASHELKTPVTSIKAYAELLVQKFSNAPDGTSFSMMTKLNRQIDRLIELIKTLLDTTKLSAGEVLLQMERFDLDALIEEQIEYLQRASPEHQIIFNGIKPHPVVADRKLIGQVITNLVSNGIKYSPKGGRILVSFMQTDEGTRVDVQDFGVGIPEGLNHKIFERYFRVNAPLTSKTQGIGLGLYITAQIVRQHGGSISVDSEEGIGSTFSFTIPDISVNESASE